MLATHSNKFILKAYTNTTNKLFTKNSINGRTMLKYIKYVIENFRHFHTFTLNKNKKPHD